MKNLTLNEAIDIFLREFPNMKIIGYWEREDSYIFNTKASRKTYNIVEPRQFVVKFDGTVYGTNPMVSNLDIEEMKVLR